MNRRQAIGLGVAAAAAIPAGWMWWNKSDLAGTSTLSEKQRTTLSAAVDTIIPETTTPGALALGVDLFVAKMIKDCYDEETGKVFGKGLDELSKSAFVSKSPQDRLEVLKSLPNNDGFADLLKNLTVRGYSTSEYVMTNIQKFEFIPGRYIGCTELI